MSDYLKKNFNSILVANRGEIACRVLRSARDLGYRTIAVHSEVDEDAPHCTPGRRCSPDRPGARRGSLTWTSARSSTPRSEPVPRPSTRAMDFCRKMRNSPSPVARPAWCFIGPPASAIELMGNKAAAKRRMIEAGVPCVPGYEGEAQEHEALIEAAGRIGFPVLVKAAAGGGGRGMRLVNKAGELAQALGQARSEAESAFGSGELIIEKAIMRPRHVEIQVFADEHGNVVHLGERDCSIQRRHQKVVEESPCRS